MDKKEIVQELNSLFELRAHGVNLAAQGVNLAGAAMARPAMVKSIYKKITPNWKKPIPPNKVRVAKQKAFKAKAAEAKKRLKIK